MISFLQSKVFIFFNHILCFNNLTFFVYSLDNFHYTILLFSITDAIDNDDFFLRNIFRYNAAVVTILNDLVENRF